MILSFVFLSKHIVGFASARHGVLFVLSAVDSRQLCHYLTLQLNLCRQFTLPGKPAKGSDVLHCRDLELYLNTVLSSTITHAHTHRMKKGELMLIKPAQLDD